MNKASTDFNASWDTKRFWKSVAVSRNSEVWGEDMQLVKSGVNILTE